ncbi:MAG: c-type cytochrome [Gemmatimonadales bacterium]
MGLRPLVPAAPLLALALLAGCERGEQTSVPPAVGYPEHVSVGGTAPPAGKLTNPFNGDNQAAAAGGRLFTSMNCDGCHGGGAIGFVGPSLVDGRWRYGGSDGALFQSIFYGRPRGMPAYGGILTEDTIWQIIAWIRTQPVPDVVATERWGK